MSKFNEDIDKFSEEYNGLINTFLELDDKAPFDNNLLNSLKSLFKESIQTIKSNSKRLDENLLQYNNDFKNIINEYYKNIDTLKSDVIKEKNEIIDKYNTSYNNVQNEIKKLTDENNRKKEAHELDIDYFITASNQNIDMFELEHEDNITRYNYQSESALLSYQNSISKNNSYLEQKLSKVKEEYSYSLIDYDIETKKILEGYNQRIEKDNKVLAEYVEAFSKITADHKDKKYKESVDLNDRIRKLSNETSMQNLDERTVYLNNQSNYQQEKEQKRSEYQLESQSISREFVLNMNELDDQITKIRNDYNKNLENEKKDLQYKLLDIHKEQEKIISSIFFSNNNEKNKKRQIKHNNKNYYLYSILEKEQSKKTLYHLNKAFSIENENSNYNKKVLELNRLFSIRSINEKELHDNKYYQELNNLDENDLNYKTTIINNQFNKKANLIKLDSIIRTIDLDTEYAKSDALHQIELERLSTSIKSSKIDSDSLKRIHQLLHETEDLKHTKKINYLVVYNLLEIEKNRVLSEYNQAQYKLNVEKETELLKYSNTNIKLKNYKYKQLKYAEIAIEKSILENDIFQLKYQDILESNIRDFDINNAIINNQYEQDKLFHEVLNVKFRNELKSVNQILAVYINAIVELKNSITNILDNIFSNIIFRPEYLDIILSFIERLLKIAINYLDDLSTTFINLEKEITNDRLSFEESFKFSLEYETIENSYKKDYEAITSKKTECEETLDEYQNKVNEYNSLIFTIQNQILYIKDPKNFALYNKQSAKKNLALLTNKINAITEQANENIAMMEPLKAEIQTYENRLKQLDFDHNAKISEIKRKQYYSALAYHNLIDDFSSSINDVKRALHTLFFQQKESKLSATNYESLINNKQTTTTNILNELIQSLYNNVNRFYNSEEKEQNDNLLELKNNHKEKLLDANNKYIYSTNLEKAKATRQKRLLNTNIRNKHNNYNNVEKKCDNLIKKNNNNHTNNSNDIINRTNIATQTFYDEFYAICANQDSITKDYNDTIKNLDEKYRKDVDNIVKEAAITKENLKKELENYIEKRKNLINNLPEKTKDEKYNTQQETKRYNRDIDQNSSDAKNNFINRRKELNNNIAEINATYGKNIVNINNEHKMQLKKEKKYHNAQLRHIK